MVPALGIDSRKLESIGHGERMEHADSIRATDLVVALRVALGLPPLDRPPTDDIPAHLPATLATEGLNPRWFILWCIAGLELFSWGTLPSMAACIVAARRAVACIAMDSSLGCLASSARLLATGPKNLKRVLVEAGTWPWVDPFYRNPPIEPVSWCSCGGGEDEPDPGEHVTSERASGALGDAGVVESGRAGLIDFRFETLDSGRAWLCHDDKREPMWRGALVHVQVAYAYAAEFGHAIVAKHE